MSNWISTYGEHVSEEESWEIYTFRQIQHYTFFGNNPAGKEQESIQISKVKFIHIEYKLEIHP